MGEYLALFCPYFNEQGIYPCSICPFTEGCLYHLEALGCFDYDDDDGYDEVI